MQKKEMVEHFITWMRWACNVNTRKSLQIIDAHGGGGEVAPNEPPKKDSKYLAIKMQ